MQLGCCSTSGLVPIGAKTLQVVSPVLSHLLGCQVLNVAIHVTDKVEPLQCMPFYMYLHHPCNVGFTIDGGQDRCIVELISGHLLWGELVQNVILLVLVG